MIRARKALDLSQADLAEAISPDANASVATSTIVRIETGKSLPSFKNALTIALQLKSDPNQLFPDLFQVGPLPDDEKVYDACVNFQERTN